MAILLTISLFVGMCLNTKAEQTSGDLTAASSVLTTEDKKWIQENFGEYKTFEDLLYIGIIPFTIELFVYDSVHDHHLPFQAFNFSVYRTKCNFHGVCFHFAQFTKIIVEEVMSETVESYIVDVRVNRIDDITHSYNYFVYNNDTYYVDLTQIVLLSQKNQPYENYVKNLGNIDFYNYSEQVLNDDVYRIY